MNNDIPLSTSNLSKKYRQPYLFLSGICLLFILCGFFVYGPGGDDDSHITYTAATNFAETGNILNNNGDWVEQGSSLLHVILLGTITSMSGFPAVDIGPLFSLFFALLCFPLCLLLAKNLSIEQPRYPLILLGLSTSFGYWAMGGLESSLFAFSALFLILRLQVSLANDALPFKDPLLWLSLFLFLAGRPESPFVIAVVFITAAVLFITQGYKTYLLRLFLIAFMALLVCLALFYIRHHFFDAYFPQPVYAKAEGLSLRKMLFGFLYFLYALQISLIVYTLLVAGFGFMILFSKLKATLNLLVTLSFCVAYLAFIVMSGGDWMTGGRFFVPVIAPLVCLVCVFLQNRKYYKQWMLGFIMISLLEVCFFSLKISSGLPFYEASSLQKKYPEFQWQDYSWSETSNLVNIRDIPFTSQLKKVTRAVLENRLFQSKPLVIASIQMGMQPYHLRKYFGDQVYFVDLRGLTTTHVTDCPAFDSIKTTWSGVYVRYQGYFDTLESCALPKPDIVYDLLNRSPAYNKKRLEALTAQGYQIIYQQHGNLVTLGGLKSLPIDAFIAVTPEAYTLLPDNLRHSAFNF